MIKGYTLKNFILRCLSELKYPQTILGKKIKYRLLNLKCKLDDKVQSTNVLWDLNYEPATFDLTYALMFVDSVCLEQKLSFNVIIIKRQRKDFKNFYPLSIEQINKRIDDMLVPLCKSFILCNEVIVLDKISQVKKFKDRNFFSFNNSNSISKFDYKLLFNKVISPDLYQGLYSNANSNKYLKKFFDKHEINRDKLITITLRTYNYEVERNTDKKFWYDILLKLKKLNYFILIIPDTDDIYNKDYRELFNEFIFADDISKNLELKIAIYEQAITNLFPYSGNATLAQLNKKASSFTYIKTNNKYKHSTISYFNSIGQTVGKNYKFLTNNHYIFWNGNSDDFLKIIINYLINKK